MTAAEQNEAGLSYRAVAERLGQSWPVIAGFCALAIPAAGIFAGEVWSSEAGSHGPLVLCIAAWLMWRQMPQIRRVATTGDAKLVAGLLFLSLSMYVFGQAFDFITLNGLGLYGVGVAIFYSRFGAKALYRSWFIFFFLLFAVPPPSIWIDALTSPLKQLVSVCATDLLQPFGIPVVHEGVVIYVAQYQLLVEDACSGMNSIVGLLAIGLLYIYLMRGNSWRYALLLAGLTIPIAILANIFRIAILILLTYFAGNDVAQGFLHFASGVFVFLVALLLVFSLDAAIYTVWLKPRRSNP